MTYPIIDAVYMAYCRIYQRAHKVAINREIDINILSALTDTPLEETRNDFIEWLKSTPYSFEDAMEACKNMALKNIPMPWLHRASR